MDQVHSSSSEVVAESVELAGEGLKVVPDSTFAGVSKRYDTAPKTDEPPLLASTGQKISHDMKEAVKELCDFSNIKAKVVPPYHAKWQIPRSQHQAFDEYYKGGFRHASILPPKNASFVESIGAYVQRWCIWASEVEDETIRTRIITSAMETMERVWRYGIDQGLYPRTVQLESSGNSKRAVKRDKNDDTLMFDDMIETTPIGFGKSNKVNYKITNREFQATQADFNAINTRIATRDIAAGEKFYNEFLCTLETRKVTVADWKNRCDITGANPYGRDLQIYCYHEVQIAHDDMKILQSYLPGFKAASQKRNTNNRIADCSARINHWLAIAIELEKVRPKDESDDEITEPDIEDVDVTPETSSEEVSKMTPVSPEHTQTDNSAFVAKNMKKFGPFDSKGNSGTVQEVGIPLTLRGPGPRRSLILKLRVPKQSVTNNTKNKQNEIEGTPTAKTSKQNHKRKSAVADSDDDYQNIEPVKKQKLVNTASEVLEDKARKEKNPTTPIQEAQYLKGSLPTPSQTGSTIATTTSHSIRSLSTAEQEQRQHYLRAFFLPKINEILKANGQSHLRIVPNHWDIVRKKLEEAGQSAKQRNELMREFKHGFLLLADKENVNNFAPTTLPSRTQAAGSANNASDVIGPTLKIMLPTFPGFDPASYTAAKTFSIPGFRYAFAGHSSLTDRIQYKAFIEHMVALSVKGEPSNDGWTRRYGQQKLIVNEAGSVVAEGAWKHFNE